MRDDVVELARDARPLTARGVLDAARRRSPHGPPSGLAPRSAPAVRCPPSTAAGAQHREDDGRGRRPPSAAGRGPASASTRTAPQSKKRASCVERRGAPLRPSRCSTISSAAAPAIGDCVKERERDRAGGRDGHGRPRRRQTASGSVVASASTASTTPTWALTPITAGSGDRLGEGQDVERDRHDRRRSPRRARSAACRSTCCASPSRGSHAGFSPLAGRRGVPAASDTASLPRAMHADESRPRGDGQDRSPGRRRRPARAVPCQAWKP